MRQDTIATIIFIIIHISATAQNNISFYEEHIDFETDSVYFKVNGIFSFCNPGEQPVGQSILFPFAAMSDKIDSIRIIDLNKISNIPFIRLKTAISFKISIPAGDSLDINIFYRQKRKAVNTYIITSVKTWKSPLKKAVYTFTSMDRPDKTGFSYEPDIEENIQGLWYYRWEKENFMPDKEFEVRY